MTENKGSILCLIGVALSLATSVSGATPLTLERAESLALETDTGYSGLIKQSQAFEDQAIADRQLPDPMLMVGWLNVPVEDFQLDQEPMNQIRLSVKQMFPGGDTLGVKRKRTLADAARVREQAVTRRLSVLQQTRSAWLETHYWEAALDIVKENEPLFEQLRDVTSSLYSTGRKGLDDVVRSELELQRLKDREQKIAEMIDAQRAALGRWTGQGEDETRLPGQLPVWTITLPSKAVMRQQIIEHPVVLAMDRQIDKLQEGIDLAKQQYKPDWSVELAYAFRNARRANGVEVSDVASIVVSMDLPVFTAKRQDKRVSAASQHYNAGLDQRFDMIKELDRKLDAELARLDKLNRRIDLYETMILPQTEQQAEAALMAYKAERSDFSEVMRSRTAQLESALQFERLQTDRLKSITTIRFLLPPEDDVTRSRAGVLGGQNEQ